MVPPWYKKNFEETIEIAQAFVMESIKKDRTFHKSVLVRLPDAAYLVPSFVEYIKSLYSNYATNMTSPCNTRRDEGMQYINSRVASAQEEFKAPNSKIPHTGYGKYEKELIASQCLPPKVTVGKPAAKAPAKIEANSKAETASIRQELFNLFETDEDNDMFEDNIPNTQQPSPIAASSSQKRQARDRERFTIKMRELLRQDQTDIAEFFQDKKSKFLSYLKNKGIVTVADYIKALETQKVSTAISTYSTHHSYQEVYSDFKKNLLTYGVQSELTEDFTNDKPEVDQEDESSEEQYCEQHTPQLTIQSVEDLNALEPYMFVKGSAEIDTVYAAMQTFLEEKTEMYLDQGYDVQSTQSLIAPLVDSYRKLVDAKRAAYEAQKRESDKRAAMAIMSERIKRDVRYKYGQPNNREYKHQHNPYADDDGMTF